MHFKNRVDAGKKLATLLEKFRGKDCVVYALPRGGIVLGAEIAKRLNSPLDLIITRKIGHPHSPEYAIGAVAENGHTIFNKEEIINVLESYLSSEAEKQKQEAKRRRDVYSSKRPPIPSEGKIAILVDDGIATGLTMKAAIKELQIHYHPSKIIVAVPVAPAEIVGELEEMGTEFATLHKEGAFLGSIGAYYHDFSPVEDEEVIKIMRETEKSNG